MHGNFDAQAPTFERAREAASAQRSGRAAAMRTIRQSAQLLASLGQPMGNNAITQNVWRTRGAKLLDEIGPAILITHGDGAVFAG